MSDRKFMVIVIGYDAKNEKAVKKAVTDLKKTKNAISEVSYVYQGFDERVISAVKSNLANAEQ